MRPTVKPVERRVHATCRLSWGTGASCRRTADILESRAVVKYIRIFLRFSKPLLIALLAVTAWLGWRASKIRFDFTMESLVRAGSRERDDY